MHKQQMNLLNYVNFSSHFASQRILSIQMQYIANIQHVIYFLFLWLTHEVINADH